NPIFITVASLEYTDGWTESYLLPLALVSGRALERVLKESPGSVLARVTGARKGAIVDGLEDDEACDRLFGLIAQGEEVASKRGSVRGLRLRNLDPSGERAWARGSGDQSNSLVFRSDKHVLKVFRRISPGPNPEFELGRVLTEHGFTRIPALHGAL